MNVFDVLELLLSVIRAHAPLIVSNALSAAAAIVLARRVAKMQKGVTSIRVFLQHASLAAALAGSVLITFTAWSAWAPAFLSAGILSFFALSLQRWRIAAPTGTMRSNPLEHAPARRLAAASRWKA
jgi:hypothetical protein